MGRSLRLVAFVVLVLITGILGTQVFWDTKKRSDRDALLAKLTSGSLKRFDLADDKLRRESFVKEASTPGHIWRMRNCSKHDLGRLCSEGFDDCSFEVYVYRKMPSFWEIKGDFSSITIVRRHNAVVVAE